jgi:hypothetical protein
MSFDDRDSSKIIVALDYDNKKEAIEMANCLDPSLCKAEGWLRVICKLWPRNNTRSSCARLQNIFRS